MSGPLALEQAIVARLREQLTSPVTVASGAALAGASVDVASLLPLVVVQPEDAEATSSANAGRVQIERQRWRVSVVERLIPDLDTLAADYAALDQRIGEVLGALSGWQAAGAFRAMRYEARQAPEIGQGVVEVALLFSTQHAWQGLG